MVVNESELRRVVERELDEEIWRKFEEDAMCAGAKACCNGE